MKTIIFLGLLLISFSINAQTGVGTTTPNQSAKLEIFSNNKGFLPPRISLTGIYDQTSIPNPAVGLLVYCKGDAGLEAGYYYWNGNAWATMATAGGSGSVVAENGTQILSSNLSISTSTPIDVLSFTLPSAGTWQVISFLRAEGTPGFVGAYGIYDPSGTLVPNSEILTANGQNASTGTGVINIISTSAATYKIKAWAATGSYSVITDFNGRTGVTWNKIGGNSPMSVINYGDIKTGIQSGDHNGWIKLNGRAISTLTATQQAQAIALGIGANLPDATNAFLVQNTSTLGTVSGSNSKTIAQINLPNVNFTGTAASSGDHSHTFTRPTGDANFSNGSGNTWWGSTWGSTNSTSTNGAHTHTVTVSSGGAGTALDITPKSLSVNTFIYLGY